MDGGVLMDVCTPSCSKNQFASSHVQGLPKHPPQASPSILEHDFGVYYPKPPI